MAQLSLFKNTCTCGTEYDSCTQPNKDCIEFQKHKREVYLNFSKNEETKEEYVYKVRFTNIYARSSDDMTKTYLEEEKAQQALNDWKNSAQGNTGIMTSQIRRRTLA
jgi:hypothetical protein